MRKKKNTDFYLNKNNTDFFLNISGHTMIHLTETLVTQSQNNKAL